MDACMNSRFSFLNDNGLVEYDWRFIQFRVCPRLSRDVRSTCPAKLLQNLSRVVRLSCMTAP